MNTQLVYIHIEKTAGTAMRALLTSIYGDQDIFWYGIHSESQILQPENIINYRIIGGHRNLNFYKNNKKINLYLSVVRDPVERAISLFHYCSNRELDSWIKQGLNPNSLLDTLNNSPSFIKMITNRQCTLISIHNPTFEGAIKFIYNNSFIIGCMDYIDQYVEHIGKKLQWQNSKLRKIYEGKKGYRDSINITSAIRKQITDLNEEDIKLYEYIKNKKIIDTIPKNLENFFINELKPSSSPTKKLIFTRKNIKDVTFNAKILHEFYDDKNKNLYSIEFTISNQSQFILMPDGEESFLIGWIYCNQISDKSIEGRIELPQYILPNQTITFKYVLKTRFNLSEGTLDFSLIKKGDFWFQHIFHANKYLDKGNETHVKTSK